MERWTQERFASEMAAWASRLKDNPKVLPDVSEEFSAWMYRKRYMVRRYANREWEVHVVFSVPHSCPCLFIKADKPPHLGQGFISTLDFHPILDEPMFSVHACDTHSMMDLFEIANKSPGVALLSWWSAIGNSVLQIDFSPKIFLSAMQTLMLSADDVGSSS